MVLDGATIRSAQSGGDAPDGARVLDFAVATQGVRAAVREHAERGVDVIKIMASGGNMTPGARTLLVTIPEPAEVLAEMVRPAKPGGWVASHEPDTELALCYPPLPAWDRLREIFSASFSRSGADLFIWC